MMDMFAVIMTQLVLAVETGAQSAPSSSIPFDDVLAWLRGAASVVSIIAGLFFVLAGTVGVLRLPDFYTRIHAAGLTDTMGVEFILLGLIIQSGFTQLSLKLLMVAFFLLMTSPTATHAVVHAAHAAGLKPKLGRYRSPTLDEIKNKSGETS